MPGTKNLGALVVKLEANSAQMRRELKLIEQRVDKSSRRMQGSFKGLGASTAALRGVLSKVNVGVATLAGGAGFGLAVKSALDFADGIDKVSEKLGISTDFLQESRFAADQSGVAITTLEMAMQRFARRSAEAAVGTGEAQDAIAQLGISLKDTNGNLRTSEALFRDAMAALGEVDDPAERLRLAFKLFDSEGAVLVNMAGNFDKLAKAAKGAGQVLGADTIKRAVDAKDELSKLTNEIKILGTEALVDLAPLLTGTASGLASVAHFASEAWARMRDFFNLQPKNLAESRDRLKEIDETIREVNKQVTDFVSRERSIFGREPNFDEGFFQGRKKRIAALKAERAEIEKIIESQGITKAPGIAEAPGIGSASKADATAAAKLATGIEALKRQREEAERLLVAQRRGTEAKLAEITAIEAENKARELGAKLKGEEVAQIRGLVTETAELNKLREAEEKARAKVASLDIEINQNERLLAAKINGVEATRLATAAILAENELRAVGNDISEKDIALLKERIAKNLELKDAIDRMDKNAVDLSETFTSLGEGLTRGISDSFADLVVTGESSFKQLAQSFQREFISKVLQNLVFNQLFSGLGLTGAAAGGGPIQAGRPYIVGEHGRELIIPRQSANVVPTHRLQTATAGGSTGGTVTVNVVNNSDATASATDRPDGRGGRLIEVMVEKHVDRALAGGAFDKSMHSRFALRPRGRAGA